MANSLSTGVAGLLAHQQMLNVTGNNLANVNTTAYKAQRVNFVDTLYETLRRASASPDASVGGVNSVEIGSGAIVGSVDRNFSQSTFEPTGGQYDLAIDGDGYFVLNNGSENLLTRAGTFGLDGNQLLVDRATGYTVQRYGNVGDVDGSNPGSQVPGNSNIKVPIGTTVLGIPSKEVRIEGNLSSTAVGPSPKSLLSATPYREGGNPATETTLLNDLDSNQINYVAGDSIELTGTDASGNPVNHVFNVDATTTLGDLITEINANYPDSVASIASTGAIVLSGNADGATPTDLRIADSASNIGAGGFENHPMVVGDAGSNGSIISAPVEFYDISGAAQVLDIQFRRSDEGWLIEASIDPGIASVNTPVLGEVRFNPDGSFKEIFGSLGNSVPISISYEGQDEPHVMDLQIGRTDGFVGLTQTVDNTSTLVTSDGFPSGTLTSASVQPDGSLIGLGSNGRQIPIAQLSIGFVANRHGLTAIGQNMYRTTANSGQVNFGAAASGGRGNVYSGQLESSNVDLAYEFTRLIVAQRGFSANARSITVTDEILDEVSNIIR